ncbi:fimbrial protein [Enterobacteriaceae bacterium C23F]
MNVRNFAFLPLFGLLALGVSERAMAYTYTCGPKSGTPLALVADFGTATISNPDDNKAGNTFNDIAEWHKSFHIPVKCDTPTSPTGRRWQGASSLPVATVVDGKTYYRVNEYLNAAVAIKINKYEYVPFQNIYTAQANDTNGAAQMTAGSDGMVDIMIARSFVGTSSFSALHIADIYLSKKSGVLSPEPIANIILSGVVTVPQNCVVNAGTVIKLDLGSMYSSDFTTAGEKPSTVTPKNFNVPVQCNYGASLANITLRIVGTPSNEYNDALQTDNPVVGVRVTDSNGTALRPSDPTSVIPLSLNMIDSDTYSTNVSLQAYPISLTGTAPEEGIFTALAVLRVDFS